MSHGKCSLDILVAHHEQKLRGTKRVPQPSLPNGFCHWCGDSPYFRDREKEDSLHNTSQGIWENPDLNTHLSDSSTQEIGYTHGRLIWETWIQDSLMPCAPLVSHLLHRSLLACTGRPASPACTLKLSAFLTVIKPEPRASHRIHTSTLQTLPGPGPHSKETASPQSPASGQDQKAWGLLLWVLPHFTRIPNRSPPQPVSPCCMLC